VAMTVTATQGGTAQAGTVLSVLLYSGAASVASIASGGKTASLVSSSNAAGQLSITPNATGSIIAGSATSGGTSIWVANGSTTMLGNVYNSSTPSEIGAFKSSSTTTASTPVTIGASSPTNGTPQVVLAEILAAGTLVEDTANEPAAATSTTATAVTTGSFTPNPGDLIVAVVATGGGNSGTTSITLSNTGGLSFTTLVTSTSSFYGCNAVYIAQMPGGTVPQQFPQPGGLTWRRRFRKPQQPSPPSTVVGSTSAGIDGAGSLIAGGSLAGSAAVDGAGSLIAGGSASGQGVAGIDGAGSLIAGSAEGATAAVDGAGSLITGATQGGATGMAGAGSLIAGGSVSVPGAAAVDAAGALAAGVTEQPAQALVAAGTLTSLATEQPGAAIDAAGSVIASAGAYGSAGIDGAGTLSAGGAIVLQPIQTAFNSATTGTTVTVTLGQGTGSGNTLVAVIYTGTTSITSVKLGGSADHWASATSQSSSAVGDLGIWTDPLAASGQTSVVVTVGASNATAVFVYELPGNCVVDVAGPGTLLGPSSVTSFTAGTIATTNDPDEFWIAAVGGFNDNFTSTVSMTTPPSSPWNNESIIDWNTSAYLYTSWQYVTSTGTPAYTGTTNITPASNNYYAATVITLVPQTAGGAALTGTGTLSNQVVQGESAALVATGTLGTAVTETPGTTGLVAAGTLSSKDTQGAPTALDAAGSVIANGGSFGAVSLDAAGTLTSLATEQPGAVVDGAGSVIAASTAAPGAAVDGAGSLIPHDTQTAGANLDAVASLIAFGYSINAALVGTGTLGNSVIEQSGAAIDATGTLSEDVSESSSSSLIGTGTLSAIPGTSGGAALDAVASLSNQVILYPAQTLDAAASLTSRATEAPGAALDGAGTVGAVGFAIGALIAGQGSVIAASRLGITALMVGAGSLLTAAVQSPALEAYNFGTFPQIPAGSTISSVTVVINDWSSTSAMDAITFELWDGTSARIGTTQFGTASTSQYNLDSATFTGVSYSQLATLRVRIYANAGSSNQGDQEFAGSCSLTVAFTPATNAAATTTVLKQATVFPAVTAVGSHNATVGSPGVLPTQTNFPAVTCGQLSINEHATILAEATTFPAVTAFGFVNASITVSTLACAGSVVAAIVTATSTGPDYAGSVDIQSGIGTSVGTWTSTSGIIGPPDNKDAVWTRP
jgi:hypothetical protein